MIKTENETLELPRDVVWELVRREFPLSPDYVHLSQFFMVSHPRPVREAIERYRRAIDANPFLAIENGMFGAEAEQLPPRVRRAAASYTGARPDEIALVPNTTTGLALVYHGMPLGPGDEVLTTTHDHFTQHEAIRLATRRVGAAFRKIALFERATGASEDEMLRRIRAAIRPETRAFGTTWVHSSTGLKMPIRAIAELLAEVNWARPADKRVLLVVDGTHGFGACEESVAELGADFFVSSTHKWIFAPRGTGIVHAPAAIWERIQPTIPTYSTWDLFEAWAEEREPGPTRADYVSPGGFIAYEHQWAMAEAFELHRSLGRREVAARITALNRRMKEGLGPLRDVTLHTPLDDRWSAGIVSFDVEGLDPRAVVERLLERRVIASVTPYQVPSARLSAGIMNTEDEVDRAVEAVAQITRKRRALAVAS